MIDLYCRFLDFVERKEENGQVALARLIFFTPHLACVILLFKLINFGLDVASFVFYYIVNH